MSSYKKMLVEDWIKVAPNPIQRDTEKHAAKAKHLLTPHPTHSFVFAAELPNGKLIKLDGHTRALMWKRKDVAAPMQVTVGIIPAKDMEEVEKLYKDFDSRDALETTRDKVYGAFNRHAFEPQSGLVQGGNLTSALRVAYKVLKSADVCARALGGVEKWLKDDMMSRIPSPIDMTVYLVGCERPTERLIKRRDLEKAKIDRERGK